MGKGNQKNGNLSSYSGGHDNSPTDFGYVLLSRLMYLNVIGCHCPPLSTCSLFLSKVFYLPKTLLSCFVLDPELHHMDILGIPARFLLHYGFYFSSVSCLVYM